MGLLRFNIGMPFIIHYVFCGTNNKIAPSGKKKKTIRIPNITKRFWSMFYLRICLVNGYKGRPE